MKKSLLIILSLFAFISNAQSLDQNFTMSILPKEAMTNTELNTAPASSVLKNITYFDGLGRPIQSNAIGQSPNGKDIIRHYEYDQFGRTEKSYLPLPSNQNTGNFINNPIPQIEVYYINKFGDNNPFTQQNFESSPINRVIETAAPGNDWRISVGSGNILNPSYSINTPFSNENLTASEYITLTNGAHLTGNVHLKIEESHIGHTEKFEYQTNTSIEIKNYQIQNDNIIDDSYYNANELTKNIIKNENWTPDSGALNTTRIFSDKNGRKIAEINYNNSGPNGFEKLITNYVYDDFGNLTYILPPKASNIKQVPFKYDDFNQFIQWIDFRTIKDGTGTGGVTFSYKNDKITVAFNMVLNTPQKLRNGRYGVRTELPDMYIGEVKSGKITYDLSIKNGYLDLLGSSITSSLSKTVTRNFEAEYFTPDPEILDELCFQYRYDQYNRKIAQKSPGKGWEYQIYDKWDRPVYMQDANLRKNNSWLFTRYDAYGRVLYTGKIQTTLSITSLIDQVNTLGIGNIEKRISTTNNLRGIAISYSAHNFIADNITELLTVNYFDDYSFSDPDKPSTPLTIQGQQVSLKTKGLPTAGWIKTIGKNTWSKSYTYYDQKGRSIKTYEKNHLGGSSIIESKLNFRGIIERSIMDHKRLANSEVLKINQRYEYDHNERLKAEYQKINNQDEERILVNNYEELGTLASKNIGGKTTGNSLQNITYKYNIRGWLTEINDVDDLGSNLFAYKLNYNGAIEGNDVVNDQPLFNGNISQTIWRSKHDNLKQSYVYNYDIINQLTDASYLSGNVLGRVSSYKYEVHNIKYDSNGNITSLNRKGLSGSGNPANPDFKQLDYLTYDYGDKNGNQLLSITDDGDKNLGFIDGNTFGNDYQYDENGNLTKDLNKGITKIEYNHMDLVEKVTFLNDKSLSFTFDASGRKLSKVYTDGIYSVTTEYIGGFQYQQGQLLFFPSSEGYVFKDNTNTFNYAYIYADNLGNNRLSYSDINNNGSITNNEILSNSNYYPMGSILEGEFNSAIASSFNYKFQGKELQQDNSIGLYDFGSRMYDPTVGRWFNIDPQNQYRSPYLAMGNNPITQIDPNGEFAITAAVGGAMAIGALVSVTLAGFSGQIEKPGDFFLAAGIGAASGYAGATVSAAVTGSQLGATLTLGQAIGRGAAIGGAGGFAGGFVGGAASAWTNGSNFGQGLGSGLQAGLFGGATGAAVGGITSGAKFLRAKSRFYNASGEVEGSGEPLERSDETLQEYRKKYFDRFKYNDKLIDKYDNDWIVENTTPEAKVRANTSETDFIDGRRVIRYGDRAFKNSFTLFSTMGHESVHVAHFEIPLPMTGKYTILGKTYHTRLSEYGGYSYEDKLNGNFNSFTNRFDRLGIPTHSKLTNKLRNLLIPYVRFSSWGLPTKFPSNF